MKKFLILMASLVMCSYARADGKIQHVDVPTMVVVSSISAQTGGQAQISISSGVNVGPYSSGAYTYIGNIHIEMYAAGAITGVAIPSTCTASGFAINPTYMFPTVAAIGTQVTMDMQFANPVQSSQATAVTLTCPATTNVKWNVQVAYYQGQ